MLGKEKSTLTQRRNNKGYLFVLPFIIGFFALFLYPLLQSVLYSFGQLSPSDNFKLVLEGIDNYKVALRGDVSYYRLLIKAITDMLYQMPVILIFSFIIANLLKDKFPGRGAVRLILFLPVVLSSGVIVTLGRNDSMQEMMSGALSSESTSLLSVDSLRAFLVNINISSKLASYITDAVTNILSIINHSGIQILIFLSALQSIPEALYEASSIDGASGWENFWKITFPMVIPQMIVCLVYTIIDLFVSTNNSVITYIYSVAFNKIQFGLSSAMSCIYTVIVAAVLGAFTLIFTRIFKHYR